TRAFLQELPFASLHVFPFSPRVGTRGAELHAARGVPRNEVSRRAADLRALAVEKLSAFAARAAGTIAEVVALRGGRALTDHYLDVPLAPADAARAGERLLARLEVIAGTLSATPVYSPGRPK